MKKIFTISFSVLIMGWIFFAFLAAWGCNQDVWIRAIIGVAGFMLCFAGGLSFVFMLNDSAFWVSLEELEKEKEKYREAKEKIEKIIDCENL